MTGLPKNIILSPEEVREAIDEPVPIVRIALAEPV